MPGLFAPDLVKKEFVSNFCCLVPDGFGSRSPANQFCLLPIVLHLVHNALCEDQIVADVCTARSCSYLSSGTGGIRSFAQSPTVVGPARLTASTNGSANPKTGMCSAPTYGDRLDFAGSQIWGQTRNLGGRTVDLVDLTKPRSDGRGQPQRPDMGTDTMFGRSAVQIEGQARY